MRTNDESVDVLNSEFVDDYSRATEAETSRMTIGAAKCKQLGRDLSHLYRNGRLDRYSTGLPAGDSSMGFPKWVYTYQLKRQDFALDAR